MSAKKPARKDMLHPRPEAETVYRRREGVSAENEIDLLAAVYEYILECAEEHKSGEKSSGGERESAGGSGASA